MLSTWQVARRPGILEAHLVSSDLAMHASTRGSPRNQKKLVPGTQEANSSQPGSDPRATSGWRCKVFTSCLLDIHFLHGITPKRRGGGRESRWGEHLVDPPSELDGSNDYRAVMNLGKGRGVKRIRWTEGSGRWNGEGEPEEKHLDPPLGGWKR